MKATVEIAECQQKGIIRNIVQLGRILIPIELRRMVGIDNGGKMEIYAGDDFIILKKAKRSCRICGSCDELEEIEYEKYVCGGCVTRIVKLEKK